LTSRIVTAHNAASNKKGENLAATQTIIAASIQLPIPEGCALELLDAGRRTAIVRAPATEALANCRAAEVIACRIVVVLNGLVFNAIKPEYLL
jgi:hypothetical protein